VKSVCCDREEEGTRRGKEKGIREREERKGGREKDELFYKNVLGPV